VHKNQLKIQHEKTNPQKFFLMQSVIKQKFGGATRMQPALRTTVLQTGVGVLFR
jgi:hypothetical protein